MDEPEMMKDQNLWIRKVSLSPPSLKDNTADVDRLVHALKTELETPNLEIDLSLARRIPHLLRSFEYEVACVLFRGIGHPGIFWIGKIPFRSSNHRRLGGGFGYLPGGFEIAESFERVCFGGDRL